MGFIFDVRRSNGHRTAFGDWIVNRLIYSINRRSKGIALVKWGARNNSAFVRRDAVVISKFSFAIHIRAGTRAMNIGKPYGLTKAKRILPMVYIGQ